MSFKVPVSECRTCHKSLDMTTETKMETIEPRPGHISICFYCLTIGVFDENLAIRAPSVEEDAALANNRSFSKTMERMRYLKQKYPYQGV